MRNYKYGNGKRFERLVILERVDTLSRRCQCDCGTVKIVKIAELSSGDTRSCGCLSRELTMARSTKHGAARRQKRTPTYHAWCGMRKRCLDPRQKSYKDYGGRGISIDPDWESFAQFFADMGEKPAGFSLERLNNNGPYAPGNCVWATKLQQARNTRTTFFITYDNKTQSLSAWAEEMGKPSRVIQARLRRLGWTIERALTEEVHHVRAL